MGSNPTAALVLIVLLVVIRFIGELIRGTVMNEKLKSSKLEVRASKRRNEKLVLIVAYFFETIWAVGASVVAAIGISTLTRIKSQPERA